MMAPRLSKALEKVANITTPNTSVVRSEATRETAVLILLTTPEWCPPNRV
jgi:hypothetical protein